MLNEVLKSCKKNISPDIKTDVKQRIKELVAVFYNCLEKHLIKPKVQYKTSLYFYFILVWHAIQLYVVC